MSVTSSGLVESADVYNDKSKGKKEKSNWEFSLSSMVLLMSTSDRLSLLVV